MKTNLKFIHLLFLTLLIFSCKKEDPEPVVNNDDELEEGEIIQSDEKAILSFIFLAENNDALNEDVAATINDDNQTVKAIVPLGTDLSSLLPNVEVSEKATYSPEGAKDFTNQVEYEVTAEDGSVTTYQASVTREKSSEKKILSFQFLLADNPIDNNLIGEIDEENKTITVTVPLGTDITALVPSIQLSTGATVSPEDAQDFTNEVIFTVTAEDQSSVNYEAVTILTDRDALIALYNANPNNILGWDLNDPEIGNWDGVTPISNKVRNLYLSNRGIDEIPPEI